MGGDRRKAQEGGVNMQSQESHAVAGQKHNAVKPLSSNHKNKITEVIHLHDQI